MSAISTASWYHCSVKPVSRSAGRSVVAAAAYRLGERLEDERYQAVHDYTRRRGVEYTFTVAPVDAPAWAHESEALWNAAERAEPIFPPEDMVSASELREFVFCERAWFLNRQGFRVSAEAQAHRAAGIVFHEARAGAAGRGRDPKVFWVAVLLAGAGLAILLFQFWRGIR